MSEVKKAGIVDKETTQEAVNEAASKDKYRGRLEDEKLPRGDKLKMVNDLLTDIHLYLLGSGQVSSTEAKNFRHFVVKEFERFIKSKDGDKGVKTSKILTDIVWSGYNAYIKFKLDKIDEIKKKKAARIQKILDRRDRQRSG